jgi:hypothetical protein
MTKTKHTPGPWKISKDGTAGMSHEIRAEFVTVARTYSSAKECNDNARLIAAAPELLQALKWTIGALESECGDKLHCSALYQDALAAIAKAEGGE